MSDNLDKDFKKVSKEDKEKREENKKKDGNKNDSRIHLRAPIDKVFTRRPEVNLQKEIITFNKNDM